MPRTSHGSDLWLNLTGSLRGTVTQQPATRSTRTNAESTETSRTAIEGANKKASLRTNTYDRQPDAALALSMIRLPMNPESIFLPVLKQARLRTAPEMRFSSASVLLSIRLNRPAGGAHRRSSVLLIECDHGRTGRHQQKKATQKRRLVHYFRIPSRSSMF